MRTLIRHGVYETNSSSSHSVSIGLQENKEFLLDTLYPDQDGIITIEGGEYGWDWFKHNDAATKASYAAQQFRYDDEKLQILKEVIMEQTGAEDVVFEDLENGYIDHDSSGIIDSSSTTLHDFIFNKNSWLFGGNDNSTPDPTFYHVPEFKDGKMVVPKYKYELVIEGLDTTTKFIKKPTKDEIADGIHALLDNLIYLGDSFMKDNLMWAITRSPGRVYEKSWKIDQDYSKNLILLTKKDDNTVWEIEHRLKESGKLDNVDYKERRKLILKELNKIPDAVKEVKFEIKEI
jgi:hypothetical protein